MRVDGFDGSLCSTEPRPTARSGRAVWVSGGAGYMVPVRPDIRAKEFRVDVIRPDEAVARFWDAYQRAYGIEAYVEARYAPPNGVTPNEAETELLRAA